jgi:translation machinery-associated protein 16
MRSASRDAADMSVQVKKFEPVLTYATQPFLMPPKAAAKGGKPPKKEKVFHPDSRKAGQLARNALRKGKLGNLRTKRTKKASSLLELYAFFHAALPPSSDADGDALTLPQLHAIATAWVARNDAALAAEQAARRKGRPKSPLEVRIEERRLREQETYRTGMGVSRVPSLSSTRR